MLRQSRSQSRNRVRRDCPLPGHHGTKVISIRPLILRFCFASAADAKNSINAVFSFSSSRRRFSEREGSWPKRSSLLNFSMLW